MLKEMKITNFILIEELSLDFKTGFNVISGETGSGKSILIDAICFVLGMKFNKSIVRNGEDITVVEAVFDINSESINNILSENDIEIEEYLFIRREGKLNGKSIVKINGKSVPIHILKSISKYLMDIHTQHENHDLLNSSNHIYYLDRYIGRKLCFEKYLKAYESYNLIKEKINDIKNNELNESYVEYVKFQINELMNANLMDGEDEELESKIKALSNGERINKSLQNSLQFLKYKDEYSVNNSLLNVVKSLKSIEDVFDEIKVFSNKLEEIYYEVDSLTEDIEKISENTYFDENELDGLNSRIYFINSLKKKYNKFSVDELKIYCSDLEKSIEEILNKEMILKKLESDEKKLKLKLIYEADKLNELRKKHAKQIEYEIISELDYMGMENTIFKINIVKDDRFNILGNDKVEFFISTNKGEPVKNLSKIISGGELSRIMLSLKIVFLGNEPISGIIFDEIDTGISGKIAKKVGQKMYYLSTKCQVFCITHLPQIASLSDNHYVVKKNIVDDKTYTSIRVVDYDEKVNEIAKMIGGDSVTHSAYTNAKELIESKKI